MELGLAGRRAVVTGGSKGIGLAVAHELAREGADVAICARTEDEVTAAAEALRVHGRRVEAAVLDVTDAGAVPTFIDEAAAAMGGLDILVNNAGGASPGTFRTLTDDAWQHDIDVKLMAQVRCSRAALPHLQASDAPRIINVNAVYARSPEPRFFATSVNRAACLSFSKTLAMELGPQGILVNSVNIGFVTTPQWENIRQRRAPDSSMEEFSHSLASEVPLGRFGEVDEVAGLVAFLASSRASYISGASIDVAGGLGGHV
jgi:3-oxoacyl-[acyl-carrier protein] reductase